MKKVALFVFNDEPMCFTHVLLNALDMDERGIVAGVCRACSTNMGTADSAEKQGLPLLDDMSGHPSFAGFRDAGYEVLVF